MIVVAGIIFILSAVMLPWWVTVPLAILLAPIKRSFIFLAIGGALMDVTFGAPVTTLWGFAYIYTVTFAVVGIVAEVLRTRAMN